MALSMMTLGITINKIRQSEYWKSVVMLIVIVQNVIMLDVANNPFTLRAFMLIVVMLSVVTPV